MFIAPINYQIQLFGYCSVNEDSLLELYLTSGPNAIFNTKLSGEYLIVVEGIEECHIYTSPFGVCQYYYHLHKASFYHGSTLLEVLAKSGIEWNWNWKGLADLTQLDHLLGNETLHPDIYRVPAGSYLSYTNNSLKIISKHWDAEEATSDSTPDEALQAFNQAVIRWSTDTSIVSMSGGFDSRTILSSFLKDGIKPSLLTMGYDTSTDVIIAREIAKAYGLELNIIELQLADYLEHASTISALTNGTKVAWHWHTFIYTHKAGLDPKAPFYVGSNGEFARSFYADKGILALAADVTTPLAKQIFWRRKLKMFREEELGSLPSAFRNGLSKEGRLERSGRILQLCTGKLLEGLDRLYLEQRVRNFMGNGLKLYSASVEWRTPFLDQDWVNLMWKLKRSWKLGSNWHRYAISKNFPDLLNFPVTPTKENMPAKAETFYWLPSKKCASIPYAKYDEWFRDSKILDIIYGNIEPLTSLMEKRKILQIIDEHRQTGNRTAPIAFLLTMSYWLDNLKEIKNPVSDLPTRSMN